MRATWHSALAHDCGRGGGPTSACVPWPAVAAPTRGPRGIEGGGATPRQSAILNIAWAGSRPLTNSSPNAWNPGPSESPYPYIDEPALSGVNNGQRGDVPGVPAKCQSVTRLRRSTLEPSRRARLVPTVQGQGCGGTGRPARFASASSTRRMRCEGKRHDR